MDKHDCTRIMNIIFYAVSKQKCTYITNINSVQWVSKSTGITNIKLMEVPRLRLSSQAYILHT